ncbi:MAG: hypothetical protein EOP86_13085 [Verrucomicrobiaceae bacterium]|nr:MAG: hypothetical protein EOP86_13085 [Verrucomicrobiaceae bacterium]
MTIQKALAFCLPLCAASTAQAQVNGLRVYAQMSGTPVIFDKHAAPGPLIAAGDFDRTGFYDFDAAARADYGELGALARGNRADNFTGGNSADTLLVESLFQDGLTLSGGSGQFRLVFKVEGLLTVNGGMFTTSAVRLNSNINLASVLSWERSLDHDDSPTDSLIIDETVLTDWIGFSGGGSENILVKLSAQIAPDGFTGPFIASSEFLSTAKLVSIEVVDGAGNPLAATAVSASGTAYSVNALPVPPEPLPAVKVSIEGGGVVISWPAAASAQGWRLESARNLGPVDEWTAVTATPVVAWDRNEVTDPPPEGRRFYRLRR